MLPRVQTERPGLSTNQITDNTVVFGNWEDDIWGRWGGWDVVIDPYTSAQTATVNMTINVFIDNAVRHTAASHGRVIPERNKHIGLTVPRSA